METTLSSRTSASSVPWLRRLMWAGVLTAAGMVSAAETRILEVEDHEEPGAARGLGEAIVIDVTQERARNPEPAGFERRRAALGSPAELIDQTLLDNRVYVESKGGMRASPVIIPRSAPDAEWLREMEEDLGVMAQVLANELELNNAGLERMASGIRLTMAPFNDPFGGEPMYVEGHGALFRIPVDFPFLPPEDDPPPADGEKKRTSSAWEAARQDLYGERRAFRFEEGDGPRWVQRKPRPAYDAKRVDQFKNRLIAALGEGSNIRHLNPDETLTVMATSPGREEARVESFRLLERGPDRVRQLRQRKSDRSGTLVARVLKRDIDGFAKGELSLERFRERVTLFLY